MKTFLALIKKEMMEQVRSGRGMILAVLFVLLGIMSPATAKLTPWMLSLMADSLAGSGLLVGSVSVTAMDSWMQFTKNIPMGLIAFILLESGIFTKEYQTGTLLLSLTKGVSRRWVVLSKAAVLAALWTAFYWLCFGITYGYTAYYWDQSAVRNLLFSAFCWWMFGLWTVSLTVLFSTLSGSSAGVLLGTGGTVLAAVLLGQFPQFGRAMPTLLTDGMSVIYGITEPKTCMAALIAAAGMIVACLAVSVAVFHRKQL